jgi:DNA processing protein
VTSPRRARKPAASGRPAWWSPDIPYAAVLLSLAATRGALPWMTASRLAAGIPPAELLRLDSPEPTGLATHLASLDIRFLLPGCPEWPFAEAPPDPPCAWLFVAGRPLPDASRAVAIVGGRRASPLRQAVAAKLATSLAAAGCPIVSGGAVGIDAAAHQATADSGGHTVAVLGSGLDVPYPRAHADLLARLRAGGGTVVGEHAPGARPRPSHFLPRNRLIAALASAVVVVEARERSGSLATARAAGARGSGRVLAIPGSPWDPGAAGCNALIRDGAVLVRGAADVFAELGIPATPSPVGRGQAAVPLTAAARAVLEALADGDALLQAQLANLTGMQPAELQSAILELELAGLAERSIAGVRAIDTPVADNAEW